MGSRDYLKLGDFNAICDICGLKYKGSELRKRWDGFMVCSMDYESRPPQEFVRGIKEDQSTPFSRPEVTNIFIVMPIRDTDSFALGTLIINSFRLG